MRTTSAAARVAWAACLAIALLPAARGDEVEWERHEDPAHGFALDVPAGASLVPADAPAGWLAQQAGRDGLALRAYTLLGKRLEPPALRAFAAQVTGAAEDTWEVLEEDARGRWAANAIVRAPLPNERVALWTHGVGPRGTHLFLLETSAADHARDEARQREWARSAELLGGWVIRDVRVHGVRLLMPEDAVVREQVEGPEGWGRLVISHRELRIHGFLRPGGVTAERLEAFAADVLELPPRTWNRVGEGREERGWTWYRLVRAREGNLALVGILGQGGRGSYLVVLCTTPGDYERQKALYDLWPTAVFLD